MTTKRDRVRDHVGLRTVEDHASWRDVYYRLDADLPDTMEVQ